MLQSPVIASLANNGNPPATATETECSDHIKVLASSPKSKPETIPLGNGILEGATLLSERQRKPCVASCGQTATDSDLVLLLVT